MSRRNLATKISASSYVIGSPYRERNVGDIFLVNFTRVKRIHVVVHDIFAAIDRELYLLDRT